MGNWFEQKLASMAAWFGSDEGISLVDNAIGVIYGACLAFGVVTGPLESFFALFEGVGLQAALFASPNSIVVSGTAFFLGITTKVVMLNRLEADD